MARTAGTRTGQNVMGPSGVRNNGNGGGGCGPVAPTVPQSYGAACPPGGCTADSLAAALNRSFAGEKYPCRELTYWIPLVASAGGVATFAGNSKVTICPTRVIVYSVAVPTSAMFLSAFEIGNQSQIVGDGVPIGMLVPNSWAIIPFVTDCIKSGLPFSFTIQGLGAAAVLYFGIIGPTIG